LLLSSSLVRPRVRVSRRRLKYLNVAFDDQADYIPACCILHNIIEEAEGPGDDNDPALRRSHGGDLLDRVEVHRDDEHATESERVADSVSAVYREIFPDGLNNDIGTAPHLEPLRPEEAAQSPWRDLEAGKAMRDELKEKLWPVAMAELDQRVQAGLILERAHLPPDERVRVFRRRVGDEEDMYGIHNCIPGVGSGSDGGDGQDLRGPGNDADTVGGGVHAAHMERS